MLKIRIFKKGRSSTCVFLKTKKSYAAIWVINRFCQFSKICILSYVLLQKHSFWALSIIKILPRSCIAAGFKILQERGNDWILSYFKIWKSEFKNKMSAAVQKKNNNNNFLKIQVKFTFCFFKISEEDLNQNFPRRKVCESKKYQQNPNCICLN